jgi:hypothetical protein
MHSEIMVLLDRSGSMDAIASDMEGGFNQFVKEQAEIKEPCFLTLWQFDDVAFDEVYVGKPISEVPPLKIIPRGMTPLRDSIAKAIGSAEKRLQSPQVPFGHRVFFVIITDGLENASREISKDQVKKLIEGRAGWDFVYLGANQDAVKEGTDLGIRASATATYLATDCGTAAMLGITSSAIRSSRLSGNRVSYSTADRAKMMGDASAPKEEEDAK